jgi:hypothetical protein
MARASGCGVVLSLVVSAFVLDRTMAAAEDTGKALSLQRALQLDTTLERTSWLSAHNAWNDSNAIWANQRWPLDVLLAKGIRGIDLDVHRDTDGTVKLCHGECNQFYSAEDSYEGELAKVATFLHANPNEVVIIDLEDQVNHQADVTTPLEHVFGNLLYRPADKPAGRWPTPREMIAVGKRVLVKSANHNYDGAVIWDGRLFGTGASPGWNYREVKYVNTSSCTMDGSAIQSSLIYGVMDNKVGIDTGYIDASNIGALLRCGIDILDADRWNDSMVSAAVWTWNNGEPNDANANEDCASQQATGRWNDMPCATSLAYACRRSNAPDTFLVTSGVGAWNGGAARCAAEYPGSRFAVPRNAYQNARLRAAAGTREVWIALGDAVSEGRWDISEAP